MKYTLTPKEMELVAHISLFGASGHSVSEKHTPKTRYITSIEFCCDEMAVSVLGVNRVAGNSKGFYIVVGREGWSNIPIKVCPFCGAKIEEVREEGKTNPCDLQETITGLYRSLMDNKPISTTRRCKLHPLGVPRYPGCDDVNCGETECPFNGDVHFG